MADTANPLIAALQPLVRRVRTDVTAIKRSDGSRWRDREPLTTERLAALVPDGVPRLDAIRVDAVVAGFVVALTAVVAVAADVVPPPAVAGDGLPH